MNLSSLLGGIAGALGNRIYRRFWAGNGLAMTGRWMYRTAVGWLVWEMTESTTWLGIVAFADLFPVVALSIVAGAIADRVGYLRVVRVSQFLSFAVGALLSTLVFTGTVTIHMVLVLTAVFGTLETMSTPSRISIVNALVAKEHLSSAIALGSATFNASRILGPAIAGGLILWVNIGTVMAIATGIFLLFFMVLLTLPGHRPAGGGKLSVNLFGDIVHGVVYTARHPGIRFLMILLGATGLFIRPFMELLPGFAAQVFGRGPEGLAILLSSIGLGAMAASLWLARRGQMEGLTRLISNALVLSGIALILFTVAGHIALAAFFLVWVGVFMLIGGVGSQTLIQNVVEQKVRARVMSLFILISWGLPALGALVEGWIATFFGLQHTIAAGAAITLLVWLWGRPAGRKLAGELERG
jgi:MFS family permease